MTLEILLTVISVIIGAAALLFSIFTAGIAVLAIVEWKSYWNYQKKRKEQLIEGNQAMKELLKTKESFLKEVSTIKKENKISLSQQEKISELENKINKIIEKTEDKLYVINDTSSVVSGLTGTAYSFTGAGGNRRCVKCGSPYYHYPTIYSTVDNGMCENCNRSDSQLHL